MGMSSFDWMKRFEREQDRLQRRTAALVLSVGLNVALALVVLALLWKP